MQDTTVTKLINEMTEAKMMLDTLEGIAEPHVQALLDAKRKLMLHMQATASKRTEAVNGYFAVRAEKTTPIIEDQAAITMYLNEEGFDLNEYLKLDTKMVADLAKATLKGTGEIIPGVAFNSTEYVSLKEETK